MEDRQFRCRHCGRIRKKRTRDQQYCGRERCQKERKNSWRRAKYETDPDYRANQRASTETWLASQGGSAAYYRGYRKRREERERREERRRMEQQRNHAADQATPTSTRSANSDAKIPQSIVKSGRYRLSPCDGANSDAFLVELVVIPDG